MKPYQLHIYIDESMRDQLRDAAADASRGGPRVSMAEIARQAIEAYMTREKSLDT